MDTPERIAKIEERMDIMIEKVDSLATSVSGLLKFQIEQDAISKYEEKSSTFKQKSLGIMISISAVMISATGLAIKFL